MVQSFGVQPKPPQNCRDYINADICSCSLIGPVLDAT